MLATASNGHVPRGAGHEITDARYGPGIVVEALLSVVAVLIFSCFRFAFCGRRILMIVFLLLDNFLTTRLENICPT